MKEQEHNIQVACVNWFRQKYPDRLIYAVPNGGHRNTIVGSKLKAEGVLSGVPDLFIPVARNGFHGLYIEMKAEKNRLTANQRIIMDVLMSEGYKCEICYSLSQFCNAVTNYFYEPD